MSDEKNLRECLISAFEQLKSQYQTIAEMICDVVPTKNSVRIEPVEFGRTSL
jgi:hypothetical protein